MCERSFSPLGRYGLRTLFLYGLLAIALLSPMPSTTVVPDLMDIMPAIGHVVQARAAMHERQFPIRVAPLEYDGHGYPGFQFYGQFPFTVTGVIYRFVTPDNPFQACLIMFWAALTISGFYSFRSAFWLTRSLPAAVISGALYMTAPYFLINISARGAFAESIAQGLLPMVVYFTLRCYSSPGLWRILICGVAWFTLATTHTITFFYSTMFIGLFLLLTGGFRKKALLRLKRFAMAYVLAWLLAMYYLAPIALEKNLVIRTQLLSPGPWRWLTPLPGLLSPVSLAAEPQPGGGGLSGCPNLHPAVGWPMLAGFLTVLYFCCFKRNEPLFRSGHLRRTRPVIAPLLIVFALAFVVTWTPIDFWDVLPSFFYVAQFTYRILTQVIWPGALICAYGIALLFNDIPAARQILLGMLLIGVMCSSYLPRLNSSPISIQAKIAAPALGTGGAYLYRQDALEAGIPKGYQSPVNNSGHETLLLPLAVTQAAFRRQGYIISGEISVPKDDSQVAIPVLFYPGYLDVRVDGARTTYFAIKDTYLMVGLQLNHGIHKVTVSFVGLSWANWVSLFAWLSVIFALTSIIAQQKLKAYKSLFISKDTHNSNSTNTSALAVASKKTVVPRKQDK